MNAVIASIQAQLEMDEVYHCIGKVMPRASIYTEPCDLYSCEPASQW